MIVRPLLLVSILAVWAGTGAVPPGARSADAEATSAGLGGDTPLRIRKIKARENLLQNWSFDHVRRVPMQPEEFERLVRTIRAAAPDVRRSVVGVAAARYQARMVDGRLVGRASLEIFHRAAGDVLLALEPCGLAVGEAVWETAGQEAAVLGLGEQGSLEVLVKRAGTLGFDWSLAGVGDAAKTVEFELRLPRSPSTQLVLELPKQTAPRVEHGVIVGLGGDGDSTGRWRIELGGRHRCRLRVVPTDESALQERLTRVRQSLVYDFSLHGVEVRADLHLDVRDEPLEQVAVSLDPGLQLAGAQCGGSAVPWTVVRPGSDSRATSVVLELPEPIDRIERTLRLRALGKPQIGRRWRLPRIRPEGVFWQEGTATLSVPTPLVLQEVTPIEGRLSSPLSVLGTRETVEVEYFAADSAVEVAWRWTVRPTFD